MKDGEDVGGVLRWVVPSLRLPALKHKQIQPKPLHRRVARLPSVHGVLTVLNE